MRKREKNNIILIGFMASGKSTLSKSLEKNSGFIRISTDEMIAEKMQMSIGEIFANHGEEFFRKLEVEVLFTIIEMLRDTSKKYVVDCGGGIIYASNFNELKNYGDICFLNVPYEKVLDRLKNDKSRPLASDKENLRQLYRIRLKDYKALADFEYFGTVASDFVKDLDL